jgi:hypothetical protein
MVVFWLVIVLIAASFIAGMIFKDLIVGYFIKFLNKIKSLFIKGE